MPFVKKEIPINYAENAGKEKPNERAFVYRNLNNNSNNNSSFRIEC